jgi:hypothetical protein
MVHSKWNLTHRIFLASRSPKRERIDGVQPAGGIRISYATKETENSIRPRTYRSGHHNVRASEMRSEALTYRGTSARTAQWRSAYRSNVNGRIERGRVHAGKFSFLPPRIGALRMLARARTAGTVRLSLCAMMKTLFPASAISRSCLSSSGFHGRLALRAPKIISPLQEQKPTRTVGSPL